MFNRKPMLVLILVILFCFFLSSRAAKTQSDQPNRKLVDIEITSHNYGNLNYPDTNAFVQITRLYNNGTITEKRLRMGDKATQLELDRYGNDEQARVLYVGGDPPPKSECIGFKRGQEGFHRWFADGTVQYAGRFSDRKWKTIARR